MLIIERLNTRLAGTELGYKDFRSVARWCEKNNVEIFSEEVSNKKYLIRMQFEYARMKNFIQYLKIRFKENWFDAFKAYTSMNITNVVEFEEGGKAKYISKADYYKPQGENEQRFLSRLTSKFIEL